MAEKKEAGIEIEATGVIEVIGVIGVTEEWPDETLAVTTMTGHLDGIEICLRVVIAAVLVVVVAVLVLMTEATVMNSRCRWEPAIGIRAPVRRQKRRSLHLI